MRNGNDGALGQLLPQHPLHRGGGGAIDARRGLVEDDEPGPAQHGAADADELPLALRQVLAAGVNGRVERPGRAEHARYGVGAGSVREAALGIEVVAQSTGEQHGVLLDKGDAAAQGGAVHGREVHAADGQGAAGRGARGEERVGNGGLAGAGAAEHRARRPAGDGEADAVEHGGQAVVVLKGHVGKSNGVARRRPVVGRGRLRVAGGRLRGDGVEHVHALQAHGVELQLGEALAELLHGRHGNRRLREHEADGRRRGAERDHEHDERGARDGRAHGEAEIEPKRHAPEEVVLLLKVVDGFEVALLKARLDAESADGDEAVLHDANVGDDGREVAHLEAAEAAGHGDVEAEEEDEEEGDGAEDGEQDGLVGGNGDDGHDERDEVEDEGLERLQDAAVDHGHVGDEPVLELPRRRRVVVPKRGPADLFHRRPEQALRGGDADAREQHLRAAVAHDLARRQAREHAQPHARMRARVGQAPVAARLEAPRCGRVLAPFLEEPRARNVAVPRYAVRYSQQHPQVPPAGLHVPQVHGPRDAARRAGILGVESPAGEGRVVVVRGGRMVGVVVGRVLVRGVVRMREFLLHLRGGEHARGAGVHVDDGVGDAQHKVVAVRDHDNRAVLCERPLQKASDNGGGRVVVERREGVVEEQHAARRVDGAGEGDARLLSARQADAAFLQLGHVAGGKGGEVRGERAGVDDLAVAVGVKGVLEDNVVADRLVLQPGQLLRVADGLVGDGERSAAQLHLVERGEQQRGLAGADGAADDGEPAGGHLQVEVAQDGGVGGRPGKGGAVKANGLGVGGERGGDVAVGLGHVGVDALDGDGGLPKGRHKVKGLLDRGLELGKELQRRPDDVVGQPAAQDDGKERDAGERIRRAAGDVERGDARANVRHLQALAHLKRAKRKDARAPRVGPAVELERTAGLDKVRHGLRALVRVRRALPLERDEMLDEQRVARQEDGHEREANGRGPAHNVDEKVQGEDDFDGLRHEFLEIPEALRDFVRVAAHEIDDFGIGRGLRGDGGGGGGGRRLVATTADA
ncbi:hypothetical protein BM221_010404 [Beauveria bassiana]|uniref:Uncharacterized protein n=1 Tax=Beauveria bassiana TaxID=176275 RepID=A0A2N6N8Q7_BEABA|nr:hypothetical protein BM221_010404 [Beauveria bassiana]